MSNITLYLFPRACSRVTLNALEEARLEYKLHVINIMKGEQKAPEYLKVHPGGKVPCLVVDGEPLTENAAILMYLSQHAPEAGLLPAVNSEFERFRFYSDLVWCSATFHPAVRQVRMPIRFTDGDPSGVHAKGVEYVTGIVQMLEARFDRGDWWYGNDWSIVDVYTNWCYTTAASAYPELLTQFPGVRAHSDRVQARPSFQKALERETVAKTAAGIVFPDEAA